MLFVDSLMGVKSENEVGNQLRRSAGKFMSME